ncbi:MAG: CAP domain-containing protein [Chloroflexota bacterium]|nr:CAP domain-containing protein [Chloroflexota bacterium]
MLQAHNALRVAIGAPAVRSDDRVTAAAQRHAEYLARNAAGGHEEAPAQPGFTGANVRDRLAAQGYPATTASEVATSVGPGTDGVRSLWVLPYHRLGLMHPHAVVAGWGYAESDGRRATVGVLVYDFASTAPDRVRSPAAGQRVAGMWDGQEFPDVLPAGASRPVGYPLMFLASMARTVDLRGARITGPSGETFPHHVVPQLYERDYVSIVPARPLDRGARYRVRLDLTVAGIDLVDEWEFETER